MKKFISGIVVGSLLMLSTSVFAEDGLQQIAAFLKPSLPITLDGQKATLESPPVMVDGSTYLKLRDVAKLTGVEVNWNDQTQTVELKSEIKGGTSMPAGTTAQKQIQRLLDRKNAELAEFERDLKMFQDGKEEWIKRYSEAEYSTILNEKIKHVEQLKQEKASLETELSQ